MRRKLEEPVRLKQLPLNDKLEESETTGFTKIAIKYENSKILVPITVTARKDKTITGDALLDLGSGGSVSLTSVVAKQYSLKDITPTLSFELAHGGVGGEASYRDFRAEKVIIGSFSFNDVIMDYSQNTGGALASNNYIPILNTCCQQPFHSGIAALKSYALSYLIARRQRIIVQKL